MDVLVASDIFGHTPALDRLTRELDADLIEVIDPYGGKQTFLDEAEAHAFFSEHVGIPAYGKIIKKRLQKSYLPRILIGFSVGAAAIWHLSSDPAFAGIQKAFCFYGSQIRHHTEIQPEFDIHLIFPDSEPHFNLDLLMANLDDKPGIFCHKASGGHGFMNKLSFNFDYSLYKACLEQLNTQLNTLLRI